MKAALNVIDGPEAGKSFPLKPGATLTVGRRRGADCVLASDGYLSSLHFAVDWHADGSLVVRDLNSTNGVAVNGACRAESVVTPRDRIQAGQHVFAIELDSSNSGVLGAMNEAPDVTATFQVHPCPSGLWRFEPTGNAMAPIDLARRLGNERPLLLIAHLHAIPWDPMPKVDEPSYICDWYPPDRIADLSPVLIGPDDPWDRYALIQKGWGKNALVCLFTETPKEKMLEHLRAVVRGQERLDSPPPKDQVTGFCWPVLLAAMLQFTEKETVDFWLAGVSAVLIEASPPAMWQVFSGKGFHSALERFGFTECSAEATGQEARTQ